MDAAGKLLDLYQLIVTVILLLHALSLVPQWSRDDFHPRLLRTAWWGLIMGVMQGTIIVLAIEQPAHGSARVLWWLGTALALHGWVVLQNLFAAYAFVHMHRHSAMLSTRMQWGVKPLGWLSAIMSLGCYLVIAGWV